MVRLLRLSGQVVALLSLACFTGAAILSDGNLVAETAAGNLRIEPTVLALGDLLPSASVPLLFKATNTSHRPIRVVGIESICTTWGCVSSEGLPCAVPPNSSVDLRLMLKTTGLNRPGGLGFDDGITLYCDCPAGNTLVLRVRGNVVRVGAE
jgi:hypothetical protein